MADEMAAVDQRCLCPIRPKTAIFSVNFGAKHQNIYKQMYLTNCRTLVLDPFFTNEPCEVGQVHTR